jgi:serine/threonine protein kinase
MAELRTIEKSFDAGILSVTGTILSLPDEYVIIPHLLYSSRKFDDYVITIIGPNGFFLLSYQPFFNTIAQQDMIDDYIIYLREYAVKLRDYLNVRSININPEPNLIIVTDRDLSDFEESFDDLAIVPVTNLKKIIVSKKTDKELSRNEIEELTKALRANGQLKKIKQFQFLSEIEYSDTTSSYIAYDTVLEKRVMIKEIKNYVNSEDINDLEKNEIIREAKLTMQLAHKNIVNIEQIIPKEDSLYIVIEYPDKVQTLRQLINSVKNGIHPDIVKKIVIQICEALEHAHSKGVVHRNVRPENILVGPDYSVKLTNFDLAKKIDMSTRSTFELKQMIKENPYAAPEFKLGNGGHHNIDQRVDVYATGVILYELLTNRLPNHLDERYWEPPSMYNVNVTEELDRVTLKSMRFDPHQRFSAVSALKNRIIWLGRSNDNVTSEEKYTQRQIFKRTRNSIIYQAFDSKDKKKVALKKVILDTFLTTEQRKQKLDKLLTEASIVSKLNHPYIVSVFDYFIEDGDGYIVMEWLEGKTLREVKAENNNIRIEDVINIGIQIGEALNYAHNNNIMHKDIKPENIMIYNNKITILDFGLASFLEDDDEQLRNHGTAIYMAPEQLNHDWVMDQRVDIFSLGVMLYEFITGRYPYDPSIIMSKYNNPIDPVLPSEINFVCPTILDACITKSLKINPDERYQRISDLIQDLKNIAGEEDESKNNISKPFYINSLTITAITVFVVVSMLLVYSSIQFFSKDKAENNVVNNVVVNKPELSSAEVTSEIDINKNSNENTALAVQKIKTKLAKKNENSGLAKKEKELSEISKKSGWDNPVVEVNKISLESTVDLSKGNKTIFYLVINNYSEDEMEILSRTDSGLLNIKDNLGNDYSNKVNLLSVSSDLTRVYPNSSVKGLFELDSSIPENVNELNVKISEYEGNKRVFSFTLKRK